MKRTLLILALYAICALRCQAQFIGYVSPQTVQQTLATNQACTGSVQQYAINNLGQTQHYVQINFSSAPQSIQAQLVGFDAAGNQYTISDVWMGTVGGTFRGSGYYPRIAVQVTCAPIAGTYTLSYSGAWGTYDTTAGTYLISQARKQLFSVAPQNVSNFVTFATPFLSSAGQIDLTFTGGSAGGGSLQVQCLGLTSFNVYSAALANVTTTQFFQIPDYPCPSATVSYNNNGSAGTFTMSYSFSMPGRGAPGYSYTHVTTTTATSAKTTTGFLHGVTINTGAAGTLSVFDLNAAACTGTPATNTVAVITAVATTTQTFIYDANFLNGICLKASVAMDYTVSSQ